MSIGSQIVEAVRAQFRKLAGLRRESWAVSLMKQVGIGRGGKRLTKSIPIIFPEACFKEVSLLWRWPARMF